MPWETVVGLEVHVQLSTRTKMFCGCRTTFGDPPNTNVCPVCLGLPGALPVPNAEAVRLGARAAMALGGTVHPTSVFARKNYFYPDLPKGYQISQFDQPLSTGGRVAFDSPDRGRIDVGITRLHLEEDAGKLIHDRFPGKTAVDLNRAGTPLAEIVSEPDLRSPAEARAYLTVLTADPGIRPESASAAWSRAVFGSTRTSRSAAPATHAAGDQDGSEEPSIRSRTSNGRSRPNACGRLALLESGAAVEQVTLLLQRGHRKGQAAPLQGGESRLPVFPRPRPAATRAVVGLAGQAARRAARTARGPPRSTGARLCAVHVRRPGAHQRGRARRLFRGRRRRGRRAQGGGQLGHGRRDGLVQRTRCVSVTAAKLEALIGLVRAGTVSHQAAKRVYAGMVATPDAEPLAVAKHLGLVQVSDQGALGGWVDEVLAASPARWRASGKGRRSSWRSSWAR